MQLQGHPNAAARSPSAAARSPGQLALGRCLLYLRGSELIFHQRYPILLALSHVDHVLLVLLPHGVSGLQQVSREPAREVSRQEGVLDSGAGDGGAWWWQ